MVLHCQILFSLAIAEAILMQTSAEQVPSLHRVAPRYLELVTSCNFWLFKLISALMLFMLLVMIFLFSVLISIPMGGTGLKFESGKVQNHFQSAAQHHCYCFLHEIWILKSSYSQKSPTHAFYMLLLCLQVCWWGLEVHQERIVSCKDDLLKV